MGLTRISSETPITPKFSKKSTHRLNFREEN